MSFATIKSQIATRITANIPAIKKVYQFKVNPFDGNVGTTPIAVVAPTNSESQYLSFQDNQRSYNFDIWIVHISSGLPTLAAQDLVESVIDSVMDLFDSNDHNTLGGNVAFIDAIPSGFDQVALGDSKVALMARVVLKCNKIVDIT